MNDFDKAARYAVRLLRPTAFFQWVLGGSFSQVWRFQEWLDTQAIPFPGSPDRRSDCVAWFMSAQHNQPPLAIVVELMTSMRRVTLRRLTQYCLQIQEDCAYQIDPRIDYSVIGVLVNLSGGVQDNELRITPPDVGDLGIVGKYRVVTMAQQSAELLLAEVEAGNVDRSLLVWASLMNGADNADYIQRWRAALTREPSVEIRGIVVALVVVFAEIAKRTELWKQGVQGMDEVRSQVVLEWEQRGIGIGIDIGSLKTARKTLLLVLASRFKQAVPTDVAEIIEHEGDIERLTQWFSVAGDVDSIDAFRTSIQN